MASLQKKVQIRNGHGIHVKWLMAQMSGLTQGDAVNLKKIETSLNEKVTVLKILDNDILALIDEADVFTLLREIQDSSNLSDEINETLIKIKHILKNVKLQYLHLLSLELRRFPQTMSLKNIRDYRN